MGMLHVTDKRQVRVLQRLAELKEGETFEFVDHDGLGMGEPCRVCFRNSQYLVHKRNQDSNIFIFNMVRGTVHCRSTETAVRPICVELVICDLRSQA